VTRVHRTSVLVHGADDWIQVGTLLGEETKGSIKRSKTPRPAVALHGLIIVNQAEGREKGWKLKLKA